MLKYNLLVINMLLSGLGTGAALLQTLGPTNPIINLLINGIDKIYNLLAEIIATLMLVESNILGPPLSFAF